MSQHGQCTCVTYGTGSICSSLSVPISVTIKELVSAHASCSSLALYLPGPASNLNSDRWQMGQASSNSLAAGACSRHTSCLEAEEYGYRARQHSNCCYPFPAVINRFVSVSDTC